MIIDHSPHQSDRRRTAVISCIVLHADVSSSAANTIAWLKNPRSAVSYHYIVERDGTATQLVGPERKAWHCGYSILEGQRDVNQFSIGVCFSNRQDGHETFTAAQLAAGVELCAQLCIRYSIPTTRIVTHEAIAIFPSTHPNAGQLGRKSDPGPLFPLAQFLMAVAQHVHPLGDPEE